MIRIDQVSKSFDGICAVRELSVEIREGSMFGLVGSNGAGKSTLLRMLAGILRPDRGRILVDEEAVYENPAVRQKLFYISDDPYFLPNSTAADMMVFYRDFYPGFQSDRFHQLLDRFRLEEKRKLATFSKGMKRQVSVILGLCAGTKYLLCDETFDGLDPVMREMVKGLLFSARKEQGMTLILASHNLRELEDICGRVGLLHQGGILFSGDLEEWKRTIHKVQFVLPEGTDLQVLHKLQPLKQEQRGRLLTLTCHGTEEEILAKLGDLHPVFAEAIPLSPEEIFILETEAAGYDLRKSSI